MGRGILRLATACTVWAVPLAAQTTPGNAWTVDSRALWVASAAAAGGIGLMPLDRHIRSWMLDDPHELSGSGSLAAVFRELGGPAGPVLGVAAAAVGWATGTSELLDPSLHTLEALVFTGGIVWSVKAFTGRSRPWVGDHDPGDFGMGRGFRTPEHRAFPSGHTAQAFVIATTLSEEVRRLAPNTARWLSPILYGSAALTGASRVYHDRHWASDVAFGAALGYLTSKAVYAFNHRDR